MMRLYKAMRMASRSTGPQKREYRYFCGLFEDMVYPDLCLLRRRELDGKAGFSCTGCSKDILMQCRSGQIAEPSGTDPLTGRKPAEMRQTA